MSATEITDGTAKPQYIDQGLPFDVPLLVGILAVDTVSPIAYVDQGLPFTANSRLCVTTFPPVRWDEDARPFAANERIAMSTDPVTHYTNGTPYVANGAWAVDNIEPNPGVTITQQPQDISVVDGNSAFFTVVAVSGDASPLTYQWQQLILAVWTNLTDVPPFTGTTTATLTIDPAELADTGDQFRVIVTNNVDSVTSTVATLTVTALETFYIIAENGDFCVTEDGLDNMVTELAA